MIKPKQGVEWKRLIHGQLGYWLPTALVGSKSDNPLLFSHFHSTPQMTDQSLIKSEMTLSGITARRFARSGGRPLPLRGVATPGHGEGEGPARYELFSGESLLSEENDDVDCGRGRSGAKRRGVLEMVMADAAECDKRLSPIAGQP